MISHEHKCIFIHIPKCAGTSIESALGHLDNHPGRDGQDHRPIRMIEKPAISLAALSSRENLRILLKRLRHGQRKAANPKNKLTVTRNQYRDYFKFAFVRNPWARAYSWYQNVMRDDIHKARLGITTDISLNLFLKRYMGKDILKPQIYWLKNYKGEIDLDYIGKFENLRNDFKEVTTRLKLDELELPHKVKGSGKNYIEFYDPESIELVRDFYSQEIRMFGYSFE